MYVWLTKSYHWDQKLYVYWRRRQEYSSSYIMIVSYLQLLVSEVASFKPAQIGVLRSAKNQLLWILPGTWYTAAMHDAQRQKKPSKKATKICTECCAHGLGCKIDFIGTGCTNSYLGCTKYCAWDMPHNTDINMHKVEVCLHSLNLVVFIKVFKNLQEFTWK